MSLVASGLLLARGGYKINQSLRFNSADSAYLNRTPGSSGSTTTWTISTWVKRASLGAAQMIWSAGTSGVTYLTFNADDTLKLRNSTVEYTTNWKFRDPSAWYHIVVKWDTTNGTQADRAIIYVNGVTLGTGDYSTYDKATSSEASTWNTNVTHNLGRYAFNGTSYLGGYLAEINFIDGSALTPSSFGKPDPITGAWIPKKYGGSYGTNGFYLTFADNSNTTSTTLGKDYSGNGNNWTPNNFSVTAGAGNDVLSDTPTTNWCTLNPLDNGGLAIANGNLEGTYTANAWRTARATFGITSGKWYWEVSSPNATTSSSPYQAIMAGLAKSAATLTSYVGSDASGWSYFNVDGTKYTNGSNAAYGSTWTSANTIGIAFDADNGTLTFYRDNTSQGTAFTGLASGPYFPTVSCYSGSSVTAVCNFGQRAFAYTPPTGFKALNTANLPVPTIKKPSSYMDVVAYSGAASNQSITSLGFQPDFLWIKRRNSTNSHVLQDAVRGAGKTLFSNATNAESGNTSDLISSFDANGFTVNDTYLGGSGGGGTNASGGTYVAWNWKAGGTGSSNNAGSITSTVSANASAGFSIVTWTGNATNGSVGHELGVAPKLLIVKDTDNAYNWYVFTTATGTNLRFEGLNTTSAATTQASQFTASSTTISNLTTSASLNTNGATMLMYCFAEVEGYSKFGSYTGNGSADGVFVYCGFNPAFIMVKRTDTTDNWRMYDSTRNTYNAGSYVLYPNLSNAEDASTDHLDWLSNGFKLRSTNINVSSGTYIFAAFAELPFKYANAR